MGQPMYLLIYEKAVNRRTKEELGSIYLETKTLLQKSKVQKNEIMQNAETHSGQFFKVRQRGIQVLAFTGGPGCGVHTSPGAGRPG
jgi:hypothetical protein